MERFRNDIVVRNMVSSRENRLSVEYQNLESSAHRTPGAIPGARRRRAGKSVIGLSLNRGAGLDRPFHVGRTEHGDGRIEHDDHHQPPHGIERQRLDDERGDENSRQAT